MSSEGRVDKLRWRSGWALRELWISIRSMKAQLNSDGTLIELWGSSEEGLDEHRWEGHWKEALSSKGPLDYFRGNSDWAVSKLFVSFEGTLNEIWWGYGWAPREGALEVFWWSSEGGLTQLCMSSEGALDKLWMGYGWAQRMLWISSVGSLDELRGSSGWSLKESVWALREL